MSVSNSQSSTGGLVGNGSTSQAYPILFAFELPTDLTVLRADSTGELYPLVYQTDYTLTHNEDGTGYLFTTQAWDSTNTITISRTVALTQPLTLLPGAREPSGAINDAFDRLTYISQQLDRSIQRCIRLSDASPAMSPLSTSALTSNAVVVAGDDSALHFWTIDKLAQEISARAAVPAMQNALQVLYPVGAIYFTARAGNPADILGFGTWVRYGSGRVIVSLDPNNPEFSTVGQTGGEAAHSLTADEGPSHAHSIPPQNVTTAATADHLHSVTPPATATGGQSATHTHGFTGTSNGGQGSCPIIGEAGTWQESTNAASNDHTHTVAIPQFNSGVAGGHTHTAAIPTQNTGATGSGTAHNNLQPFIVLNVWIRVGTDATEYVVGSLPFPDDPSIYTTPNGTKVRLTVNDDLSITPTAI